MFAYCGNNPVQRKDVDGESWIVVLGAIGVQYASDVIGNIIDGKTGAEVFLPTSSLADYTAAAITALIPGGSMEWVYAGNDQRARNQVSMFIVKGCCKLVFSTYIQAGYHKLLLLYQILIFVSVNYL